MSHRTSTILGLAAVVLALLAIPLVWQEYQQARAIKMVPDVLSIADTIPLPGDAVLITDNGPSANEYSAVVWRYYTTNWSDEQIRSAVFEFASQAGYRGWKEERPASGRAFSARKGEFEIRLHLHPPAEGSRFALSANWYGSDR